MKIERASRLHEWVKEMNNVLRLKVIKAERHALGLPTEFDIENNTGYLLDIEITDDGRIIISEIDSETKPTKGATK